MENGKDYQILETNLKPSFWRNLKNILRQNKKSLVLQFLFGNTYGIESSNDNYRQGSNPHLEDKIAALQNQVNSLQARVTHLEAKGKNPEYPISGTLGVPDVTKTIQQGIYTLKTNMGSYLPDTMFSK